MNTRVITRALMQAAVVAGVLVVCAPASMNGAPEATFISGLVQTSSLWDRET